MRDFYFRNRVVGPKGDGIAANNFHLNDSAGIVFFRKISDNVWIIGQRMNEFHHLFALRARTRRSRENFFIDEDRIRPHELIFVQTSLEFVRREPVGFVGVIEPVGDFAVINGVLRVTQLQSVGNQIRLLLLVQQCHFAFNLLETHKRILTR
jgi:hypothetical protein